VPDAAWWWARLRDLMAIAIFFAGDSAMAQTTALTEAAERNTWSFSASVYAYIVPEDRDYLQPTFLAARGRLVFDAGSSSDSYFYNWSELTLAPAAWFRFGGVIQRKRAYESDREIQRGLLAGFSYRSVDLSTYVFNSDDDKPTVVLALGLRS